MKKIENPTEIYDFEVRNAKILNHVSDILVNLLGILLLGTALFGLAIESLTFYMEIPAQAKINVVIFALIYFLICSLYVAIEIAILPLRNQESL